MQCKTVIYKLTVLGKTVDDPPTEILIVVNRPIAKKYLLQVAGLLLDDGFADEALNEDFTVLAQDYVKVEQLN